MITSTHSGNKSLSALVKPAVQLKTGASLVYTIFSPLFMCYAGGRVKGGGGIERFGMVAHGLVTLYYEGKQS